MDLFAIDFDEKLFRDFCYKSTLLKDLYFSSTPVHFTEKEITELIGQADEAIAKGCENPQGRAAAYVWKFQLLSYQEKLAPKLLEKALALCPDMPEALIRMGAFFYIKDSNKNKMLEYINRVIEASPSFACAWLLRAYFSLNNKEQVIADCAEYSRLKPDSSSGYELCARYIDPINNHEVDMQPDDVKHDFEPAIYNYTEAIRLNPSNRYNYLNRGKLYLKREESYGTEDDHRSALSDIITLFLMIPEDDFNDYPFYFGNFFSDAKPSLKEQYLTEIINTISPEKTFYWLTYMELAEYYCYQKHYDKSIAAYSFAIAQNAKGSVIQLLAYSRRANVYRKIGEYDKALDDYSTIVEHGSWVTEEYNRSLKSNSYFKIPYTIIPMNAINERANIYDYFYHLDNKDNLTEIEIREKAISEYSKAIELAKLLDNELMVIDILEERAGVYYAIHDFDKALDDYSAIINLDTEEITECLITAYEQRIAIYLEQGKKEKAFEDFVKMNEVKDKNHFDADKIKSVYEVLDD